MTRPLRSIHLVDGVTGEARVASHDGFAFLVRQHGIDVVEPEWRTGHRPPAGTIARRERGDGAIRPARKTPDRPSGVNAPVTEPFHGSGQQHLVQLAAMNAELRRVVASIDAARLPPDHLAEAVGVNQVDAGAELRQLARVNGVLLSASFDRRGWPRVSQTRDEAA